MKAVTIERASVLILRKDETAVVRAPLHAILRLRRSSPFMILLIGLFAGNTS